MRTEPSWRRCLGTELSVRGHWPAGRRGDRAKLHGEFGPQEPWLGCGAEAEGLASEGLTLDRPPSLSGQATWVYGDKSLRSGLGGCRPPGLERVRDKAGTHYSNQSRPSNAAFCRDLGEASRHPKGSHALHPHPHAHPLPYTHLAQHFGASWLSVCAGPAHVVGVRPTGCSTPHSQPSSTQSRLGTRGRRSTSLGVCSGERDSDGLGSTSVCWLGPV